jgi:hypothetical protein
MRGGSLPFLVQVFLVILWALISLLMLVFALIGLACVVLGVISMFFEPGRFLELQLGGEIVQTTTQKLLFTAVGAVMAVAGIAFWWLRQHDRIGAAVFCYLVLMALFLAISWATGRGDIVSVGG